jgi:hypothetical protein
MFHDKEYDFLQNLLSRKLGKLVYIKPNEWDEYETD